jgi:hypothetical protein
MHKGVKCLDASTGRVYISRDVVFDENLFPFSDLHPNAGCRLKEDILLLPSSSYVDAQNIVGHMSPIVPITDAVQVAVVLLKKIMLKIMQNMMQKIMQKIIELALNPRRNIPLFLIPRWIPPGPRCPRHARLLIPRRILPGPLCRPRHARRLLIPRQILPGPHRPRPRTVRGLRLRLPRGVAGVAVAPLSGKMILWVPASPDLLCHQILQQVILNIVTMMIMLILLLLYNLLHLLVPVFDKV